MSEPSFIRYFWVFRLAVLGAAGLLSARAVNGVVASALRPPPSTLTEDIGGRAPETAARVAHVPTQRLLERNIFGAEREEVEFAGRVDVGWATQVEAFSLESCQNRSGLRLRLVGTVVSSVDESASLAIFSNPSDGQTLAVYSGERIDAATIRQVRSRRVLVENRGRCEYLSLDDDARPEVVSAVSSLPVEAPLDGLEPEAKLGGSLRKLGDDIYELPRQELDEALSNLGLLSTSARIVPSLQDGKVTGFKLFSIRPGSLLSQVGLHNGDAVRRINGYELKSTADALEIYSRIRDSTTITVDIERRGRPQTMTFQIR